MPIALDPNEIYPYVISTDRTLPTDKQPTLQFYFPTCKETQQISKFLDDADEAKDIPTRFQLQCDAIRLILAGWKNFTNRKGEPVPFDPNRLDEIISNQDLAELKVLLLHEMSMTELDKKKLALYPPSSTAESAANATTASA